MKYRVVIADDEAKIIRLIEELGQWGSLGIEIVDTCTTGSAALESILRHRPDFVLSDIKMPGLDGLELIQKVRDAGAAPLFILISGYRHFEYARTAVSLGVMDYLLKPVDEAQLNETLERVCRRIDHLRGQQADSEEARSVRRSREREQTSRLFSEVIFGDRRLAGRYLMSEESCNARYATRFAPGCYRALCVFSNLSEIMGGNSSMSSDRFEKCMTESFPDYISYCSISTYKGMILLLNYAPERKRELRQAIDAFYYSVRNLREVFGKFRLHIGVSAVHTSIQMAKLLEVRHVTKLYPGVVALDDVSFDVERGEILALIGENGAGKSTVIKTISGAVQPEKGTIVIDGREFSRLTPSLAKENGIGVVYQEFNLVPSLSVMENIFLGDKVGNRRGLPDFKEMKRRSVEILQDLGVQIDPMTQVQMLSTAQMQIVEIAKALVKNCKLLIMDEPTASIPMAEVSNLFRIVRRLKEKGVSIIHISHRLEELFELCDRVTVFRDGRFVVTRNVAEITKKDLIRYMIGRELTEKFPERNVEIGETVLELRDLTGNGDFHINLQLHKGEILGLAGLVGAGRTELAKMICGDVKPEGGEILVRNKKMRASSVADMVDHGSSLIPEDRKQEGAFLQYSIEWNIPVMSLR